MTWSVGESGRVQAGRIHARRRRRLVSLAAIPLIWMGCASGGGPGGPGAGASEPAREPHPAASAQAAEDLLQVRFAPGYTIPLIRLESRDVLSLQFDVLGSVASTYSIQFTPASREWVPSHAPEPRPMPSPDRILDYENYFGVDFQYIRYSYQFPNPQVSFPRSGNYLLEVYDEDTGGVIFSRRFVVSDDELDLRIQPSPRYYTEFADEIRPEVRVDLPRDPNYATEDCTVCFVKNGWTDQTYCTAAPRIEGPTYVFTAEVAPHATREIRYADLSSDQFVSRRYEYEVPNTAILFPDDLRATPDWAHSTPRPRSSTSGSKELMPYLLAQFGVFNVPDAVGAPYLIGDFNNWTAGPEYQMKRDPESDSYTVDVLLENGPVYYTFVWPNRDTVIDRTQFEGPSKVSYTVLLYAKDVRYPTDRVLTVRAQQLP
ncbi:MAG: DUF5103 domain-containing protein [Candidatus Eisenbacteria bacterium]|uniref:DUF5103 domain-containing protein n=1 Tax=Eiseniibacteriota bacterium TaxID=2212470 RepID=A0A956RMN0_UNCEI|nr:DUF5103 domain-containing protein [Candidatus Eisenbacteria bacterium]